MSRTPPIVHFKVIPDAQVEGGEISSDGAVGISIRGGRINQCQTEPEGGGIRSRDCTSGQGREGNNLGELLEGVEGKSCPRGRKGGQQ